jgi:hypothetical protein
LSTKSFSVLARHHQRNGKPKPPDPQDLQDIRTKGSQQPHKPSHSPSDQGNANNDRKHNLRPLDGDRGAVQDPTLLKFYPHIWRDVLEHAKEKFRLFLTSVNAFPTRILGLQEAKDCLTEALEDFRQADKKVEKGMHAIPIVAFFR